MVNLTIKFPQTLSFGIETEGQAISLDDVMHERSSKSDLEVGIKDDVGNQRESMYIKRETLFRIKSLKLCIRHG